MDVLIYVYTLKRIQYIFVEQKLEGWLTDYLVPEEEYILTCESYI